MILGGFQEEYTLEHIPLVGPTQLRKRVYDTPLKKGNIYVMIAHYRDDWCDRTVNELFRKCKHCDRVFVGVSEQLLAGSEDVLCGSSLPSYPRNHVRIIHMNHTEAKGPTFSRYLSSVLWRGEEYFLQLDAHMHFIQDWDNELIRTLALTPAGLEARGLLDPSRVVYSTYPVANERELKHKIVPWICNATISGAPKGMIMQRAAAWYDRDKYHGQLNPTPFLAAGFLFASSARTLLLDAPFDPHLPYLFHGEELLYAARLWTHGWSFFVPPTNTVMHLYGNRNHTWFGNSQNAESARTLQRARLILGQAVSPNSANLEDIEAFGLGTRRTLDAYLEYAGLEYSKDRQEFLVSFPRCKHGFDWGTQEWVRNKDNYNKNNM